MATEEVVVRLSTIDNLSGTLRKVQGELSALKKSATGMSTGTAKGMDTLTRSTLNYGGALRHINASLSGFNQGLNRTIGRTAMGLTAMTGGALALGLKSAASFELSRSALGALLGDTAKGNAMFKEMQAYNFAAPFDLEGIAAAGQTLLQFGISGEKMMPVLKGLGDVAAMSAGNPIENLKSMSLALGQISSAGVMRAQDMNQLVQAGFPAYKLLSEISGKTSTQLRKDMETGLTIPADKFVGAITAMQGKTLSIYKGGAAKQNETLFGQWSNFKDRLKINLSDMLGSSLPGIKTELNDLGVDLAKMIQKIGPQLPGLISSLSDLAPVVVDLTGAFADLITRTAPFVADVVDLLGPKGVETLLKVLLGYAALGKVVGVVRTFSEALAILKGVEAGTAATTAATAAGAGGGLLSKTAPVLETASAWGSKVGRLGKLVPFLRKSAILGVGSQPEQSDIRTDTSGIKYSVQPGQKDIAENRLYGSKADATAAANHFNYAVSVIVNNPRNATDVQEGVKYALEHHIKSRQARGGG